MTERTIFRAGSGVPHGAPVQMLSAFGFQLGAGTLVFIIASVNLHASWGDSILAKAASLTLDFLVLPASLLYPARRHSKGYGQAITAFQLSLWLFSGWRCAHAILGASNGHALLPFLEPPRRALDRGVHVSGLLHSSAVLGLNLALHKTDPKRAAPVRRVRGRLSGRTAAVSAQRLAPAPQQRPSSFDSTRPAGPRSRWTQLRGSERRSLNSAR